MTTIQCKICGFSGKSLTSHICRKHKITCQEYVDRFGGPIQTMSVEQKRKLSKIGIEKYKNPERRKTMSAVQKNGASIFTTKYWIKRGFSELDAMRKVSEIQSKNSKKSNQSEKSKSWMQVKFWLDRGVDQKAAELEISKRQSKLSNRSSKFLGCKRTDSSKKKISLAMRQKINEIGTGRWASHFGKFSGRSNAEIKCYTYLKDNVEPKLEANVPIGSYIVDMLIGNKIIEFNGDFWHANPKLYKPTDELKPCGGPTKLASTIWENEKIRLDDLRKLGYDVFVMWESEWSNERESTINKIKHFLYGNT